MAGEGADDTAAMDAAHAAVVVWLSENWNPDLSVREWWASLAESGWAFPTWPKDVGGREMPAWAKALVESAIEESGALGAPDSPGQSFGAQALIGFATAEQQRRFLPALGRGEEFWCQLFSEPGAGSDLGSLRTTARRDNGRWLVNGQKTWSSAAQFADRGLLLARTDPDLPAHKGISLFVLPLDQPGVTIRPIHQMNERDEFTEVFFDDAEIPADCLIGELNEGWRVATLTMAYERHDVGGTGPSPGRRAGLLDQRAGDVVSGAVSGPTVGLPVGSGLAELLTRAARAAEVTDPAQRRAIADVFVLNAALDAARRRVTAVAARGNPPGPGGSVTKLAFSRLGRTARDAAVDLLGRDGNLRSASHDSLAGELQDMILTMPGLTIGAGTDEIQRNILSERVLMMPREPRVPPADKPTTPGADR